jgi:hypothetical protein
MMPDCIYIPYLSIMEILKLKATCMLLLVFGPHVLETVYTSFKQSIGV